MVCAWNVVVGQDRGLYGDGFNWHCHNWDTGDIPSVHCQLQYVKFPMYGVEGISFSIMYIPLR